MFNILTITRRDLGALFTSPIGYIYIMVFVTVSVGLYVTGFFSSPIITVDIRPFFDNLPLLLCVFVPAVTMRVWAEERKENTWEMLLTFPMRAYELVAGKFLACIIFFAVAMLATFTVPWMLSSLGNPDNGAIVGGYLGAMLVGAMFFAMGIFFSGFFKDQIVAFVVTLLACFMLFLLGTNFLAGYLDNATGSWNLGTTLSELLGVFNHFSPFTRGVVDLADVLYFVAWTVLFLVLNLIYIDGRSRPLARTIFAGALLITVGIGLLFNWIVSDASLKRLDLTENKVYTVSEAAIRQFRNLDGPVTVTYYVTPAEDMPTGLKQIERDVTDKLEELQVAAGDKFRFKVIHLRAENYVAAYFDQQEALLQGEKPEEDAEKEVLEARLFQKGVRPFSVGVSGTASYASQAVYSSIGVAYGAKDEEILPNIVPATLSQLEYRLVSTVYKLGLDRRPIVALLAQEDIPDYIRQVMQMQGMDPSQVPDPFESLAQFLQQQDYDVRRVELTQDSPLPEDYDTLLILNPRGLEERQRWEVNRALHAGKSVVMAVQQYTWDYSSRFEETTGRVQLTLNRNEMNPGVNELLDRYGITVSEATLMDVSTLNVPVPVDQRYQLLELPTHILVLSENMNQDSAATSNLAGLAYTWGTALKPDTAKLDELGLDVQTLMTTTSRAWEQTAEPGGPGFSFEPPAGERQPLPLAVRVRGQFPDVYAGQERPAWPQPQPMPGQPPIPPQPEDGPVEPVEAKPGQLILMGCAEPFKEIYLRFGQIMGEISGLPLLLKMVDTASMPEDIAQIRARTLEARSIEKPAANVITRWQVINYGLANVSLAIIGIAVVVFRRQRRNAYTMSFAGDKG